MSARTGTAGARRAIAVGSALLLLMSFLLFMSSRTGQQTFQHAQQRLDAVVIFNLRLDAAMFPLLFEVQISVDELTELHAELRTAMEHFGESVRTEPAAALGELMAQKLVLMEDFKSQQALLRNSRAIVAQMIDALREQSDVLASGRQADVLAVERAFLEYLTVRDPGGAAALEAVMRTVSISAPELAGITEWEVLDVHVHHLLRAGESNLALLQQMWMLPVPQSLRENADLLAAQLATENATAFRYRVALFAVAVLLLAFGAWKASQVRRYVQLTRRANEELDARVRRRTDELARTNEALRREMIEREGVESQLRLAQKLESIGQLASGIAHEINTPAQYVSDNVTFLECAWQDLAPLLSDYERSMRDGGDRERAELWKRADVDYLRTEVPAALGQARSGLQQIADIVRAIRNFSHPGQDALQTIDINEAVETTALVARNEWKYVASLVTDLDHHLPLVFCDASAINQVILNLIVNAAQAIGEQRGAGQLGRIRISTRRVEDFVEIAVEDDGPGVPEAMRERIFDPFFTTRDVGDGAGHGLAVAHRVVARHGGTLEVGEGSGGRGACFRIRLPLNAPDDHVDGGETTRRVRQAEPA